MAKAPNTGSSEKGKRELGPRVSYVMLRSMDGVDNKTLKGLVVGISSNRSELIDKLDNGEIATYVKVTQERKPRSPKASTA